MRKKLTKRQKEAAKHCEEKKVYKLEEAVDILKTIPKGKFDETIELSMNLNLNPKDPGQIVRGTALLPHGTGKNVRVVVFCKDADSEKAKAVGADYAGSDELVKKVSDGWCDFDVAISTPEMMKEIARLGRVLGPRGMMPNPKTGTVTNDIAKTVKEVKAGKIDFKVDKFGIIHASVAKVSFERDKIVENAKELINTIIKLKPSSAKGTYVKSIYMSSTMSPSVPVDPKSVTA